jgi:hypothetical protein
MKEAQLLRAMVEQLHVEMSDESDPSDSEPIMLVAVHTVVFTMDRMPRRTLFAFAQAATFFLTSWRCGSTTITL